MALSRDPSLQKLDALGIMPRDSDITGFEALKFQEDFLQTVFHG